MEEVAERPAVPEGGVQVAHLDGGGRVLGGYRWVVWLCIDDGLVVVVDGWWMVGGSLVNLAS